MLQTGIDTDVSDEVAALVEERATLIDWVLERLDDIKSQLNDIDMGIDNPVLPPRGFDLPVGAESALEAIAAAVFKAERVWSR